MKKHHFIFILLCTVCTCLSAQNITGEIIYDYRLKLKDVTLPRKATLLFTDTTSVFYHSRGKGITAVDIDGRVGGPLMSYTSGPEHSGMATIDFYKKDGLGHTFYYNRNRDELIAREIIYFRSFLYQEPEIPQPEWVLLDTTKIIGDYFCQGASTDFRGRNYFVWYTPEIPLPHGPWKLQGLPGIILEAKDEEKRIVFVAETIKFGLKNKDLKKIYPPDKAKRTVSFEEFKSIHWKEQLRVNRIAESTGDRTQSYDGIKRHRTLEIFN